jgi:hypothetical protein
MNNHHKAQNASQFETAQNELEGKLMPLMRASAYGAAGTGGLHELD